MKTEFLTGFGLSDEDIQKILAENGKDIEREKAKTATALKDVETLKEEKKSLTNKITELSDNAVSADEYKTKLETLQNEIAEKEEKARLEAEDKELTDSILESIKDKKFSSDYAKEGVIRDMKNLVAQKENKGKSYTEIFENLTKDKPGIFENPNQLKDMTGMGSFEDGTSEETMRAIMGLAPSKE